MLRVRPFITDDARVVGAGLAQVESWVRSDHESHQLWVLGAVGPTSWLELTLGGVVGAERHMGTEKGAQIRLEETWDAGGERRP